MPRLLPIAPSAIPPLAGAAVSCAIVACTIEATPEARRVDEMGEVRTRAAYYDLVDVAEAAPEVVIDLRYRLSDNVTRAPLYADDMPCLLRTGTAAKLDRASQLLADLGYRLVVWDAYRPPEVQVALWELTGGNLANYVGNPHVGWSAHCCGIAVDVALADPEGQLLAMPTAFDHFGPAASIRAKVVDPAARRHRDILQATMIKAGFDPYEGEWWHFEDPDFVPLAAYDVVRGREIGVPLPSSVWAAVAEFQRDSGPAVP